MINVFLITGLVAVPLFTNVPQNTAVPSNVNTNHHVVDTETEPVIVVPAA